jgi:hypothetical protein
MGLSDDVDAALPYFRAAAQSMMNDLCEIGTVTMNGPIDPVTLEYTPTFNPVYIGPCQFKAGDTQVQAVDAASQLLVQQNNFLKLPVGDDDRITSGSSAAVSKNMVARITASRTDPALVGAEARILGPFHADYTSARRFPVEVTT